MRTSLSILLAGVFTLLFASANAAKPGAGTDPIDCSKWKDKARCELLNKDILACRDKVDDAWRKCMHLPASPVKFVAPKLRDCTKTRNKERCLAHNTALEACKDHLTRDEHRKCMAEQLPAAAPKKS